MNRKVFALTLIVLLISVSCNAVMFARGQVETLDFRLRALALGECVVGYGEVGSSGPLPLEWGGLGDGRVEISGRATDAVVYPHPFLGLYVSQDIKATGMINVGWTGEEGSKHRLVVVIYSTDTSEGAFIPNVNGFALTATTLPGFTPEKTLSFSGVYISNSGVETIKGRALVGASTYGPPPFPHYITVFLGAEKSGTWGTAFSIVWSLTQTEIGLGQTYFDPPFITLSAAKVYESLVRIT